MANHGTPFGKRNKIMRERTEAMRQIWTEEEAQYSGETLSFGQLKTWPKPVQQPYPPVLIGGGIPYGARRAIAYGDGWIPHAFRPEYRLLDRLGEFRAMEKEAGREIPITAFGVEHDAKHWAEYSDAGISRIVLSIDSEPRDTILSKLDTWANQFNRARR